MSNPIIQREFVGLLRNRRAFYIQVGLVAVLAALVVLRWPANSQVNLSGEQSQQVLRLFGYGLLAGLILLAPVFPATAVVREKQQGTLALLLNSPLTPWSIFVGKLLGAMGFVLLLLALSFPAAAACFVMGGVDFVSQIGVVYLILLLVALEYATLALYISTRVSTADSAMRLTYGSILLLAIVPLMPKQFLQGHVDPTVAQVVDTLACVSPLTPMMDVLGQGGVGSEGLLGGGNVVAKFAASAVFFIALFTVLTMLRLNLKIFDRNRSAGVVTDERSTGVKLYRRIMYLWFFDPQRRAGAIGRFTNPVMVKEFRTQKFGRSHWMMRLVGACLCISLGLMLATTRGTQNWGVETLGGIIVILQTALVVFVTPSLASGLISGERESGGWILLQSTPLSTFSIVFGKLLSSSRTVLLLLIATLPAYGMIWLIDKDQTPRVVAALITLILTAGMALMVSAAVSSLFSRTATATAVSYAVIVGLCGGTLLAWLGRDAPFPRGLVEWVLQFNPLAAALSIIGVSSFSEYHLVPAAWYILIGEMVLAGAVLMFQTWRLTRPR